MSVMASNGLAYQWGPCLVLETHSSQVCAEGTKGCCQRHHQNDLIVLAGTVDVNCKVCGCYSLLQACPCGCHESASRAAEVPSAIRAELRGGDS